MRSPPPHQELTLHSIGGDGSEYGIFLQPHTLRFFVIWIFPLWNLYNELGIELALLTFGKCRLHAVNSLESFPALLFLLMTVCPNLMEFCVDSCWWLVGLLFCPLQALTWQKWFSTQSWFTMAGLITELGNFCILICTIDWNPKHIDCKSNQSLLDTNLLLSSPHSSFQDFMKL